MSSDREGLDEIEEQLRRLYLERPVLVFIGNPLRGDDKVGLLIGKRFIRVSRYPYVVICWEGIENCISKIKQMSRGSLLIVDAVHAGLAPGTIIFAGQGEVDENFLASTHSLPLSILSGVHKLEFHVLGIQVENTEIDQPVSPKVLRAARMVLQLLKKTFS
ncbi:hydrogenase maturation protease [Thermofilum sp.]|uniref:hydrogenase maturation protease n=1 Tax=Thermofilum sp. TaxID=1961369 RepID=UPI002587100E|nr:hydrogenase maturation protease [Thermofilum sp.]